MILAHQLVAFLNCLAEADNPGMSELVEARVDCDGPALRATGKVITFKPDDDESPEQVGLLGVLNGLLMSTGVVGRVSATWDDEGKLSFQEWQPQ